MDTFTQAVDSMLHVKVAYSLQLENAELGPTCNIVPCNAEGKALVVSHRLPSFIQHRCGSVPKITAKTTLFNHAKLGQVDVSKGNYRQ